MKRPPIALPIRENVPLAPYTTLEVGGPARYFVEARKEGDVPAALDFASARSLPVLILGGGSNILISDAGFPGLVLRMSLRGIEQKDDKIEAAAGEEWDLLVRRCVEKDLAGIECLSGIPGTVGGTPVQNVGAYGQEASETIASVRVLNRETHRFETLSSEGCGFGYRRSIFNTDQQEHYVVLAVAYRLRRAGEPRLVYPDLIRYFSGRAGRPALSEVRQAVLAIRARKAMLLQPGDPDARSAGSFFKNPVVSEAKALLVEAAARRRGCLSEGEAMPRYKATDGGTKIPAAWLIERAGFSKGYTRGRVGLSSKHTLALINRGGATAVELVGLMRDIQAAVNEAFGIGLVPEPVLVGFE